jgi:hypothetical protein
MAGNAVRVERADLAFFCRHYEDTADPQRRFAMSSADFALINPNTRTCPIFRTRADAELTAKIHQRVPVLDNERSRSNPWGISFKQGLFNMTSDSGLFRTEPGDGLLPLYEAKMIWQYDHRFGSYEGRSERGFTNLGETSSTKYRDPTWSPTSFYWVPTTEVSARLNDYNHEWLIGFRDVTNATNERTAIFSVLPIVGVGHTAPLILVSCGIHTKTAACFLANVNSLPFDYVTRQKIGGMHITYSLLRQLPVLSPTAYSPLSTAFIVPRILELVYTAWDIKAFADDLWRDAAADLSGLGDLTGLIRAQWETNRAATGGHPWDPPAWAEMAPVGCPLPPFKWDEDRRSLLRAELDAYYARLYGLTRDELRYILDPKDVYGPDFPGETFRVLKEKEERAYGEYRTGRLVLEAWDRPERSSP